MGKGCDISRVIIQLHLMKAAAQKNNLALPTWRRMMASLAFPADLHTVLYPLPEGFGATT